MRIARGRTGGPITVERHAPGAGPAGGTRSETHRRRLLGLLLLGALALFAAWPWLPVPGRERPAHTLVVYGFSILGEVMTEGIFPAFEAEWLARTGEPVRVIGAFAGSGIITSQITMGAPAEVAVLALELDALRLSSRGVVPEYAWRSLPHGGVVNRTPFVILVRPGNPKGIRDLDDLASPGVGVVHPDPLTSGGATWALVAEYGAGLRQGGTEEAGARLLAGVWSNVVARAASARAARTQFENGFGDALLTYEQEALRDRALGRLRAEIVYPKSTVLSEHVVVRLDRHVEPGSEARVDAFLDFLWSERGQRIFVEYGFRSVEPRLNAQNPEFGRIRDPFTVEDLGGWPLVQEVIVEKLWRDRVLVEGR